MIFQAFCFYTYHSWKNSILTRLRRLRQPKYLIGAVVGFLYFYFLVFGRAAARNIKGAPLFAIPPDTTQLIHTCAAGLLFLLFLFAWIFPRERAALVFTEAEVAFLFPAPIGRKTLINFKLLRTQLMILISAVMFTIFTRGFGSGSLMRVLGWWMALSTLGMHNLGSSFALTTLTERGLSTWKRRIAVLTIIAIGIATIGWFTYQTAPPLPHITDTNDISELQKYYVDLSNSGAIYCLLLPFRLLTAPFFATTWLGFVSVAGPALLILLAHYWWVISANVAFEEASIELSRKTAEKIAAMRAGQWGVKKPTKAKRSPFQLTPDGSPAIALFWKNLISSGQIFSRRFWFLVIWAIFMTAMFSRGQFGWAFGISICTMLFVVMSIFLGPQLVRLDFRQDLPMSDVLKTFPMPGWQVILGEILAPAVLLACTQWLLIAVFLVISPSHFAQASLSFAAKLSVCATAAIVLPFLNLITVLIQNAAVLILPAWFQFDKSTPRGIETMGQQLILMFGQIIVLALCLIPAAIAFGGITFVAQLALPWNVSVIFGAIAAAAVLVGEVAIALRLLGKVFERFDLSAELNER
jgi:ABC-2 type transport system permease protein